MAIFPKPPRLPTLALLVGDLVGEVPGVFDGERPSCDSPIVPSALRVEDMRYCKAAVFAPGCFAKERKVFVSKLGCTAALELALEVPPQVAAEVGDGSSSDVCAPRNAAFGRPGATLMPVPTEDMLLGPMPNPEGLEDDLPSWLSPRSGAACCSD